MEHPLDQIVALAADATDLILAAKAAYRFGRWVGVLLWGDDDG